MIYHLKKGLYNFTIFCRKFLYSFYSFIKIIILSRFKYRIPKVEGKEIVVIGNAPSFVEDLNKYPEFFKRDLMCVNNFPSSEHYEKLQPAYIVLIDNSYFPSNNKLQPWAEKTLSGIVEKTTWDAMLFVPQFARNAEYINTIPLKNKNVKVQFYNYTIVDGFDWLTHRLFKWNLGMPACKNVLPAAIFVAINMAYKNIYLSGVDNSFFRDIVVDRDNELYINMSYFYAKDNKKRSGQFYHNLERNEKMDVSDFFKWCHFTFLGYKKIKAYSKFTGTRIVNTTESSYIDAFERRTISEL